MGSHIVTKLGDIIEVPGATYRKWGEDYIRLMDSRHGDTLAVVPRESVSAVMMTDEFEIKGGNTNR